MGALAITSKVDWRHYYLPCLSTRLVSLYRNSFLDIAQLYLSL